MEQGPAHTPEHNSVAERYNRTIMERCRAQMIHAALPKFLWGEIVMATSHILNMSPTRSTTDIPVNVWQQACAGSGAHLSDHSFLRVLGCQALVHIHKARRRKLDACAEELILVGYETGSKAYRLWNPNTRRIVISRDVTFNEAHFPLRQASIHDIPCDDDDDDYVISSPDTPTDSISSDTSPIEPTPEEPVPDPAPTLTSDTPSSRPSRASRAPLRYGNIISYAAAARAVIDEDNPTYAQAMAGPDAQHWEAAMQVEFDSLVSHSVGRLIQRPPNANVLGGMWRFKRKKDTNGAITKYKARWVILGNHQIRGLDYFETYASVGVKESLNTLYALAASEDLELESFDIITAFLTGSMDVPVHSVQVKGFEDESRDVLLLDQSIYGAKQAHRQFNATLKVNLASIGFHSTEVDDSLYSKWDGTDFVHIHMHVDDGLVVSNSVELIHKTRTALSTLYDVKWNSNPTEHLGIRITRDRPRRLLHLSQESYLQSVIDRFGMEHSNTVSTPLLNSTRLATASAEEFAAHSEFPYRQIIGCLNHAAVNTRPDISHAVSQLAQHSSYYGATHITAAKHLLRYVKGTLDRGMLFKQHDVSPHLLAGYADADYANDVNTRRSTTGYTITVGGSTVCWRSRRQRSVALSTTEAEYMAMGDCAKHLLWFRRLMYILTLRDVPTTAINTIPTTIFNDNNGAVFLSKEAAINSRSKHIDIRHHFIRELVNQRVIHPAMIDTKQMPADSLTKAAGVLVIDRCRRLNGNLAWDEEGF